VKASSPLASYYLRNLRAHSRLPGVYLVDELLEVKVQPAGTPHHKGERAALLVGFRLAFWPSTSSTRKAESGSVTMPTLLSISKI
jgi:hypothetical protein